MKNILLKCDEKFFYKLKEGKSIKEQELERSLTWEEYIKLLFERGK